MQLIHLAFMVAFAAAPITSMTPQELEKSVEAAGEKEKMAELTFADVLKMEFKMTAPEGAKHDGNFINGKDDRKFKISGPYVNIAKQAKASFEAGRENWKLVVDSKGVRIFVHTFGDFTTYAFDITVPLGDLSCYMSGSAQSLDDTLLMIKCARTIKLAKETPANPEDALKAIGWEVGEMYVSSSGTGSDKTMALLKGMTGVTTLSLHADEITDAGLAHIAGMTKLENLTLGGSGITGAGLAHLKNMAVLKSLNLGFSNIEDAGFKNLPQLKSLEELNLSYVPITDASLAQVGKITSLKRLVLASRRNQNTKKMGPQIKGTGLRGLATLAKLEELDLSDNAIEDAGIATLVPLKGLTRLDLANTSITDASVIHLAKFKKLKNLSLKGTKVSDAGVARLNKALPAVEVFR